ncbi:MAG: hypothetical protein WEB13_10605, partial [Dehalococcoidia bacterium]
AATGFTIAVARSSFVDRRAAAFAADASGRTILRGGRVIVRTTLASVMLRCDVLERRRAGEVGGRNG